METFKIISDLGFPIACVLGMAYFLNKQSMEIREDSRRREDRMFEEIKENRLVLSQITHTLTSIDNRIEDLENRIK